MRRAARIGYHEATTLGEAGPYGAAAGAEPVHHALSPLRQDIATTDVAAALARIVGKQNVLSDRTSMMTYECDAASLYKSPPHVVVFPTTTEEVAEIVRYANAGGIPFIPRGGGTGLSGGCLPAHGGIMIALNKMDRILELDIPNQRAVVQPGVVNLWVTQAAEPYGYHFAPDPSSQKACTIGGNVAENSGGPHTLKFGVTVNHVTGLELVLPDGDVVRLGGMMEEGVGYDLLGLVIGSEGTMGIATEITLKLTRNPEAFKTLLAVFDSIDDASTTVSDIIGQGIIPTALEMMDTLVIRAVEDAFDFGFPRDAAAVLIVELDGVEAGMERQARRIVDICQSHRAREVRVAQDMAERERLWKSRKQAFGALGRLSVSFLTQDGVVPRTRLPEVLRTVYDVSTKYDLPIANVFHAGDGNIHPIMLFDERIPEQCDLVLRASADILRKCVEVGGTITGEHGVGVEKIEFMPLLFRPRDLQLMRELQTLFNPRNLCNPGKILPREGTERACTHTDA
jgi:glycolate oxidase